MKSSAAVEPALASMQRTLTEIEQILDLLEQQCDLLAVSWSGEAMEAFVSAERDWRTSIRHLHQLAAKARARASLHREDVVALDSRRAGAWRR